MSYTGTPPEDKLGLGSPTENPFVSISNHHTIFTNKRLSLFLNIVSPPSYSSTTPPAKPHPVKIYIHGGFLQFGSPHSLSSQAQYISELKGEIWVNIGYRCPFINNTHEFVSLMKGIKVICSWIPGERGTRGRFEWELWV